MTSRIDIIAPATISLLGSLVESADPVALAVSDPAGATLTLTIIAGNAGAALSASATAGAIVASNANTLTISGTAVQVNAALASLEISDNAADTLKLTATGAGLLGAATDIAVNLIPTTGPAFAAPPASFAMSPYIINNIGVLVLGDPAATALTAAGLGHMETMAVTLSAVSGVLFLPGYSQLSGISASGIGTGQIELSFTADQLPAVNALLASLQWAGPAAVSGLVYAARDVAGPLGATVTSGNIVLNITGTQGPATTMVSGADTAILGAVSLSLGSVLNITGITADIGGINGQGAVFIAPNAAFEVPYNLLSLGGTCFDFGSLSAASLSLNGNLLAAGGAAFSGPVNIGAAGEIVFAGSLIAGGGNTVDGIADISLSAGAMIIGSGNLIAGNFSESGAIIGAGTIRADTGDTLVIAAGQISGIALQVAAGGVLEVGPIDPLYGVFNATPLSIDASMHLTFLDASGAVMPSGRFADTLGQSGGVIVINSPEFFSGTIINFQPGDRLVFPGLTGLTLSSITSNGFIASGVDSSNTVQSYSINAAIPAGTSPFVGMDADGDAQVSLRDAQPDVFLGGSIWGVLQTQPGTPQPLAGFSVLPRSWNGQSLSVTLSVGNGVFSGPGIASSGLVTITAASPTALNAELQALSYTANTGATFDRLTITSASASLSGLFNILPISPALNSTTTNGYFGDAAQQALFNTDAIVPVQAVAAPGALFVAADVLFDTALIIPGLSGTALNVASNAIAIFDPGSNLALGADVTVASSGLLGVLTDQFSVASNVSVAGSMILSGAVTASGSLAVTGAVAQSGNLAASALSIAAGAVVQQAAGTSNIGTLSLSGTLAAFGASQLTAASAAILGNLQLGGTASFAISKNLFLDGTISVGADAVLSASSATQAGGLISFAGLEIFQNGLISDGQIDITSGTILSPFLSLQSGAILAGGGVIAAGTKIGTLISAGTILAQGNLLIADDITLAAGGGITIAAGAALGLAHGVTGGTIAFAGADAMLTINDAGVFSAAVAGMLDHDVIDLIGIAPAQVSVSGGQISLADQNQQPLGQFGLGIAAGQPALTLVADGHGGTLITLGGDMPCFARYTRLLTPNGYRPIESLAPGDPVITHGGERRAIRWIGWRTLNVQSAYPAQPVRFAAHCLAPGVPARPVYLSPLHAVFIGGVLVPACHLVNGATITRPVQAAITYYHVELDRHDILIADGMAAESYLDTGNRGQLDHEVGRRGRATKTCADLVTSGPKLAVIRRKLHQIAVQAGFSLTYRPALRGVAGQSSVLPRMAKRRNRRELRFAFPAPVASLGLVGQACAPADTDPDSEDRRQLGLCLSAIPPGATLTNGWFERADDDAGIWMGASAGLDFAGARQDLTLALAAIVQSWVPPAPTSMRHWTASISARDVDFPVPAP